MFRKLMKNKKAQNTAEYAILISLVVAGIIAMQTYAQRALQARVRGAAQYLKTETSELGNEVQYEPYYLDTSYTIDRNSVDVKRMDNTITGTQQDVFDRTQRAIGGYQVSNYAGFNLANGV